MKIIRITKEEINDNELKAYEDRGMRLINITPAFISAFTAIKIAKAIDRHDADIVETTRLDDTLAAISARKLTTKKDYKIVCRILPNAPIPIAIPQDILNGVDGWIFSSQRLMGEFPKGYKNGIVIQPISFVDLGQYDKIICDEVVISWIGDIVNTNRLRRCLDIVERSGNFTLRICGAGKAKDVMPLVRMTRHMPNGNKVIWVGEEYRLLPEIAACHAAIITDNDISAFETALACSGAWLIHPEEIEAIVADPGNYQAKIDLSHKNYIENLRLYYDSLTADTTVTTVQ